MVQVEVLEVDIGIRNRIGDSFELSDSIPSRLREEDVNFGERPASKTASKALRADEGKVERQFHSVANATKPLKEFNLARRLGGATGNTGFLRGLLFLLINLHRLNEVVV